MVVLIDTPDTPVRHGAHRMATTRRGPRRCTVPASVTPGVLLKHAKMV